MPHFTAITVDRFINTGASNSVDRPNQGTRTVRKASSTNSKPWDYLRLEKRYSLPSTRRPVVEKGDASNRKNATETSEDEKGSGSHSFASESSSRVWRTSSDSIISELGNGAIINECQIGCSNLENGVAVEEGKTDVRNGHTGEDGCEMPSTGSHGVASESSSHVWLTTSDSISSEHVNDAITDECQIGCINLENGISVEERNEDVINGHIGEDVCEMPSTDSLGSESDSEDLYVPHDSDWFAASDSIISEHLNVAIVNDSQIGCINLENGIAIVEGNDDVRNGHTGEDVFEMPSTDSLDKKSDSEDLCVPHDTVWLTASGSIISEHVNDVIINECHIECINLENGIAVEEGNDDIRNGHSGEDVCEMPSTHSLGRESDSEDLCVPHDSIWITASDSIISEHVNDAIINECQIGCSNLKNGMALEEGNDDVRNGHSGEHVCEMPSTNSLGRKSDSEDLCVPHNSDWFTASDSITSEHMNVAIINESQIGCINLENGISVEEGNDKVINSHIVEVVCEMPSTHSLGRESDSEDLYVPHDSVWLSAHDSIISEHVNDAIINECQIGCINLEKGIAGEVGNDDVRNGHIGEVVCEMPSTNSLCREIDNEDLCVPHDSVCLTASDSITSEHINVAIINESQIGRINLENGIAIEEGNDDIRKGHIGEDIREMHSTNSLCRVIDSEDLCVPHDSVCLTVSGTITSEHVNDAITDECQIGCFNLENGIAVEEGNDDVRNGHIGEDVCEIPSTDSIGRESDSEDLCDCLNLVSSYTSLKDEEECGTFSRLATPTPGVEFYDACEELSSVKNSGKAALEDELVEIRLSLSIETENRNQAEKALVNIQTRWERMREHLSLVGITLPPSSENEATNSDPAEEIISQQVQVIRFVSESIGRAIGKAEAETEMENQVEAKNFEITRLCDRLHYYEAVNREMSQRNQQVAAEGTRRLGKRRKWRQRWIWGSIGVTISIGVVAVACKYLQTGKSTTMHCSIEE